jgi:uncharacterized protein YdeI (YjbR/CyaY-like superfamily)
MALVGLSTMSTPRKSRDAPTTRRKAATKAPGRTPEVESGDPVLALPSAEKWDAWLRANHGRSAGVLLKIPKRSAGNTLTYAAALEVALAWGWIDSQKQALDETAWLQRFTPRRPRSPWSKINRAKAEALTASGRMEAPGLAEVDRAKRDGRWERAYESARTSIVPDDLADALSRNDRARAFFETLDAANRYAILYRVTTAKRAETRAKRIATFVAMCAAHKTLHPARTRARAKPVPARQPSTHR